LSKTISLIIPTYNERDNITPLVQRIHRALSNYDYEIIFVDDNSKDGTAELINALSREYPVKVLIRQDKRGLASAVVDGLRYIGGEVVGVLDADLQHPPEILPEMLEALKKYDVVVASRYCRGGGVSGWSLKRKIVSRVANLLALPLAPKVKDRMSGYFGFRRAVLSPALLRRVNPAGFKICLELLAKGHYRTVTEVPYIFAPRVRGESKLSQKVMRQYLKQLVGLYWQSKFVRFALVGASGAVVKLVTLFLLTDIAKLHYLVSYIPAFSLSVVNNYLWNSLWTFRQNRGLVGLLKYAEVSLLSLGIYESLLYVFTEFAGLWYMASAVLVVIIAFLVNYFMSRRFVWYGR